MHSQPNDAIYDDDKMYPQLDVKMHDNDVMHHYFDSIHKYNRLHP